MAVANRTAQGNTVQRQDTPEAALQALACSILNREKGHGRPTTFAELCNALDRGPSRVSEAITALRASGYIVRLTGMRAFAN